MRTLLIIIIILSFSKVLNGQSIEKFSIDSGGASADLGSMEVLYTIGEVNVQERTSPSIQVSEGFIGPAPRVLVDPKLLLQGPVLTPVTPGLMNDDLRILGYLPTTSPYPDQANAVASVFNAGGSGGGGLADDDIVDWVWLELRDANDNTKIINARSALLQRDGDVVDLDGLSSVVMQAAQNTYYLVVSHRNHLAAMTGNTYGLSPVTTPIDFSNNGFVSFGSNAQTVLGSGHNALWAGDAKGNGQVRFSGADNDTNTIKDYVLADPGNGFNSVTYTSSGYLDIDINMNGGGRFSGSGNDSNVIKDNVLGHPGNGFNSVTYIISPTVPPGN